MEIKNLQTVIDTAITEKNKQKFPPQDYWRPSLFGRCERLQYLSRLPDTKFVSPDMRTLRIFAAGNIFHNWVQSYLPPHMSEVVCNREDVAGRADIVTADSVIDIKSQHSRAFWYAKANNYDVKNEKRTNWLQITAYAWMLDKPRLKLVFVSKDDLCIAEYDDLTEKWLPALQAELTTLRKYWEAKQLPPKNPRAYNGKDCDYCGCRDYCATL